MATFLKQRLLYAYLAPLSTGHVTARSCFAFSTEFHFKQDGRVRWQSSSTLLYLSPSSKPVFCLPSAMHHASFQMHHLRSVWVYCLVEIRCCQLMEKAIVGLVCRLWLRTTQRRQTSIQPQGKHATWNEHFHLPVDIDKRQKLVVVLYDHDTIGSDDELGRSALLHSSRYAPSCTAS